jgi:hypothetical protein
MYYFVSKQNFNGQILYPRVPENRMTCEDADTPRICVSKSINGCLSAVGVFGEDEVYVHWCESSNVIQPTVDQVPDCPFTGEEWIVEPVVMNGFMKIKIIGYQMMSVNNMSIWIYTFRQIED